VSSTVVGTAKIQKFADCTRIATSPIGSNAYSVTMAYVKAVGTNPRVLQLPTTAAIVPSILSGENDCAVNAANTFVQGVDSGSVHVVVDPQKPETMPDPSVLNATGVVIYGNGETLGAKRDAVVKLMKALNQAVAYMATHSVTEIATALAKYSDLAGFTVPQLEVSYKADQPFLAPNKGHLDANQWSNNITLYAHSFPYIASGDPKWAYTNVVDMTYLETASKQ
jgi:ABC-type nitrate/sulfonate/bicarbonate transport system substrate-binding protein